MRRPAAPVSATRPARRARPPPSHRRAGPRSRSGAGRRSRHRPRAGSGSRPRPRISARSLRASAPESRRVLGEIVARRPSALPACGSASIPSSRSTSCGIGVGAPVSGSEPEETFGNATIWRMSGSPAISATKRSSPIANPPCGGAPISSASSRKPNFEATSSSLIPITRKTAAWRSERWIRIDPEPSSQPFQIRS